MIKQVQGFSLIELMVVVVIATTLTAIAIPNFSDLVNRIRVNTQVSQLMESFTLARYYAVNSHSHVSVCGSTNGNSCNGAWDKGILAYSHTGATTELGDSEDTKVLYHHKVDDTFTMQGNIRKFTFRPSGLLRGRSGSVLYCPKHNTSDNLRRIVISRGGRVRSYTPNELSRIRYLSEMQCS